MLKYVILWAMVNNQPRMVARFTPLKETIISVARDTDAALNCENVARELRALGARAWCVPHVDL